MLTVPVLDLNQGIVVHAVAGNRENYQAVCSDICISPDPIDVIRGLLNVYNFKSLYIADLDALEQHGNHVDIIKSICHTFPNLEIWIDTGYMLIDHYLLKANLNNLRIILSSESLPSITSFTSTINKHKHHNFILSLDYKADCLIGLQELLQHKDQWPKNVIVLNLNSVGVEQGYQFPSDLDQTELTNNYNIFYGGGIRHISEMLYLKSIGFAGALVSTALHKKHITGNDILQLNQ